MHFLQSRWKLNGNYLVYYGLRNEENLFKNKIKLNKEEIVLISKLPCELTPMELKIGAKLIGKQIVEEKDLIYVPQSIEEARFCKTCAANDFIIPGMEFNADGICPICQKKELISTFKGLNPIVNTFKRTKKSRFDIAVFYTGGKDSTYLLYYLAKVLNLRVLALTWEIPYMSESARLSIENAKHKLDNVEFITRYISNNDLRKMYRKLYELSENTCACPTLAYALFYPELVANKIPYFIVGNEPAQIVGLYFNHIAPSYAFSFASNKFLNTLINIGRVITLHPPYRSGQFQTMATMKQMAKGNNFFVKKSGYANDLVTNICEAMKEIDGLVKPLKRAIRQSSWSGNIPRFVQVDFNEIAGGVYDWRAVKEIIKIECGWVAPEDLGKGLHTSCKIEKCKEYSQYKKFREMRSTMIPFSALEISLASQSRCLTKEEAINEINDCLGFSVEEIPECAIMKEYIK